MADIVGFKFVPLVKKGRQNELDEPTDDIQYWLTRPAQERISAVTFLVFQSIDANERLDKTAIRKAIRQSI